MVRRATHQVDGYLFLLPEHVDGVAEYPFYAKVTARSTDTATARSIDLDDPVTCDIDIATARTLTVSKAEATRTRQRRLLRQVAWTESAARFWHGQVIGVEGRLVRLQPEDRVVLVEPSRLTPVAPLVALLLLRVPLYASMTQDRLLDMQTTIIARILDGSTGTPASNAIPAILDDLVDVADLPDGNSTRLDYAFVVDENHPAPTALRLAVGPSFCRDPFTRNSTDNNPVSQSREPSTPCSNTSIEQASNIVSLFAPEEEPRPGPTEAATQPRGNCSRRMDPTPGEPKPRCDSNLHGSGTRDLRSAATVVQGTSTPAPGAPSLDAQIMEVLLHQPELLIRFLQAISSTSSAATSSSASNNEPIRRTSKYAFALTTVQVSDHNSITAPEHRGKSPSVFAEIVIHAVTVRLQPHPGVIIRLYDFQFGLLGLSILHFVPFGVHQRMSWLNIGGVNMQNFSAGVTAPKPRAASPMGGLIDAAPMLCCYGQEFLAQPVRDVLEALLDFLQQLDGWHSWVVADLPHLVFWVNAVLEQFLSLVHASAGDIHASSLQNIACLSLNDGELQNVMYALSRRSSQVPLQQGTLHQQQTQHRPSASAPNRDRGSQHQTRIPPSIFDLIPTHNGLPVCLRYLSALGCPAGSSTRCGYGARAHVAPNSLDPRVKGHIIQLGETALSGSSSEPARPIPVQHVPRAIPPVGVSLELAARVRACLSVQLRRDKNRLTSAWRRHLGLPVSAHGDSGIDAGTIEQEAVSNYATRRGMSLVEVVRLRRGEADNDSRPNKGLDPARLAKLLQGYPLVNLLAQIARSGIRPSWASEQPPRKKPPKNHNSSRQFQSALLKSIRDGQANGTYLVVNLSMLLKGGDIQCSPFGAVEKKGVDPQDEVRPIHALSYPESASTSDHFDFDSAPDIAYISVVALARRIEYLAREHPDKVIKMLKGDVKSAFRHLMLYAMHLRWMGATFPDENALVIDLAAPFGWSGSPAFYSAFGRAIS